MRPITDLSGQIFHRLTVIGLNVEMSKQKQRVFWDTQCECGTFKTIRADHFTSPTKKNTLSCGCLNQELIRTRKTNLTHGKSGSKVYWCWHHIQDRCNNPEDIAYPRYGKRGIKCLWTSFENFYADMGDPPDESYSIERIDNNGHYEKSNCKWGTKIEQANNTTKTKYVTFRNETKSLAMWTRELGLPYRTIWARLKAGREVDDALTATIKTTTAPKVTRPRVSR